MFLNNFDKFKPQFYAKKAKVLLFGLCKKKAFAMLVHSVKD